MASQPGTLQASAHSGIATAYSGAASDASHGNVDHVVDSAASQLAAQSQISSALASEAQPVAVLPQPVASESGMRQEVEPESETALFP